MIEFLHDHGVYWLVAGVLIAAAIIDGRQLRVPNRLTFPFAAAGLAFSLVPGGLSPLDALLGALVGLAVLLPLYAVGGMGAGDVKLLAGVGAWIGPALTWQVFVATAIVGAIIALVMILTSGQAAVHFRRMRAIAQEWFVLRDPVALAEIAAARKPAMKLLPYGIPIAIGAIFILLRGGMLI